MGIRTGTIYSSKQDPCFQSEELLQLDKAGMPEPLSNDELTEITNSIFDRFHEEIVSCAVCNQFKQVSKCKLFPFKKVPQ
jgi:hypothetical protein